MPDKNKEILIFSPFYPPHIGGVENYTQDLCQHLSEKNISITIFTPWLPKTSMGEEVQAGNIRISRFPAFEIIHNYPLPQFWRPSFWKKFHNLFNKQYAVVFSQTRFFSTSLLALVYAKLKKSRWVHIEHGSGFVQTDRSYVSIFSRLYDQCLGRVVLSSADEVIAISESVKKFVARLAPRAECQTIYRGFDFEKIEAIRSNQELREKYPNKTIITYIGRLIDGKGVLDLIEAIRNIQEDFVLFIIGDGPEKKNMQNLIEKYSLENKVIFFGYRNHSDAIGILKISDIFINPSYSEGLPTTVAEAGMCRKATIATKVGGTNEIITDGKSGFLIEPRDIEALRQNISKLCQNKDLQNELGNSLYADMRNKFSWEKSTSKFLAIISDNN